MVGQYLVAEAAELAVGKSFCEQPTRLFEPGGVSGSCSTFLAIAHGPLNDTERAHGILV